MLNKLLIALSLTFSASAAMADSFVFYDDHGKQTVIDTSTLNGCVVVFDSGRRPIEVCRMEEVSNNTVVVPSSSNTVVVPGYNPNVHVRPDRAQDRATSRRVYRRMERRH